MPNCFPGLSSPVTLMSSRNFLKSIVAYINWVRFLCPCIVFILSAKSRHLEIVENQRERERKNREARRVRIRKKWPRKKELKQRGRRWWWLVAAWVALSSQNPCSPLLKSFLSTRNPHNSPLLFYFRRTLIHHHSWSLFRVNLFIFPELRSKTPWGRLMAKWH